MKQLRIGLSYLTPMFYPNMKLRIEQMAEQGWVIKSINEFFAVYEKHKAKKIRCHIAYFEPLALMEPFPGKERDALIHQYESDGWKLIDAKEGHQLYITEDYNAVPKQMDESIRERNIKRLQMKSWFFLAMFILLMLLYAGYIGSSINMMLLLTSEIWIAFLICFFITLHGIKEYGLYRYWIRKNNDWIASNEKEPFMFSDRIALLQYLSSFIFNAIMLFLILYFVMSGPISKSLQAVIRIVIPIVIGQLFRRSVKRGKHSGEMYSSILAGLLFIAFVIPNDWVYASLNRYLPEPAIDTTDVITLDDLSLTEREPSELNRTMKSIFTTKQADYTQYTPNHRISTRYYVFRNSKFLEWYMKSFEKKHHLVPFSESVNNDFQINGGYLDNDTTRIYFIKDNTIYIVSSSVSFEDRAVMKIVTTKLLRGE